MVKCPRCGREIPNPSKEWNYSRYHVKLFACGQCDKTFKAYYCEGKFSHTIPKPK